jgi:hypothetical protein
MPDERLRYAQVKKRRARCKIVAVSTEVVFGTTEAMAAGLTDRVWHMREFLLFRVPPWHQVEAVV